MKDYCIQPGDTFYSLAQKMGGTCEDWLRANPHVNPVSLQVGQKVVLPELKSGLKGREQYAEISVNQGKEFAGDHLDDIEMEIEGVKFKVKRIGESKIPHEIHLILPRTEIRKVQPAGESGPCEVQVMLSNMNIIHSPRLMSEQGQQVKIEKTTTTPAKQEEVRAAGTAATGTTGTTGMQTATGEAAQDNPLARIRELSKEIRPSEGQTAQPMNNRPGGLFKRGIRRLGS